MASSQHQRLVEEVCRATGAVSNRRFSQLVFEALRTDGSLLREFHPDTCGCDACDEDVTWSRPQTKFERRQSIHRLWTEIKELRVVPDAVLIDSKKLIVTVYEVELSSPMRAYKYNDAYWLFDRSAWTFEVFVVDGRDGAMRQFLLTEAVFDECGDRHEKLEE